MDNSIGSRPKRPCSCSLNWRYLQQKQQQRSNNNNNNNNGNTIRNANKNAVNIWTTLLAINIGPFENDLNKLDTNYVCVIHRKKEIHHFGIINNASSFGRMKCRLSHKLRNFRQCHIIYMQNQSYSLSWESHSEKTFSNCSRPRARILIVTQIATVFISLVK